MSYTLIGTAGSVSGGYIRDGESIRYSLTWVASPGAIFTSAQPDYLGSTLTYFDQSVSVIAVHDPNLPGYATVASLTVTSIGSDWGFSENLINFATFA